MLRKEQNDLLCHTGPGTPMGNLFRASWQPALLAVYVVTGLALGAAAVVLVLLQAFFIHAWCTLCLASATVSLILAIPAAAAAAEACRRRASTPRVSPTRPRTGRGRCPPW